MNKHYPIHGQLPAVLYEDINDTLEAISKRVFLPLTGAWSKPASEVLKLQTAQYLDIFGLKISRYTHLSFRKTYDHSAYIQEGGTKSFSMAVVLRGQVVVEWWDDIVKLEHGMYGEGEAFIFDTAFIHVFRPINHTVVGLFSPDLTPHLDFERAVTNIANVMSLRNSGEPTQPATLI